MEFMSASSTDCRNISPIWRPKGIEGSLNFSRQQHMELSKKLACAMPDLTNGSLFPSMDTLETHRKILSLNLQT